MAGETWLALLVVLSLLGGGLSSECSADAPNEKKATEAPKTYNPSEFYSSVVNMEMLLKSEQDILERFDKYIRHAEEKIKFLKRQRDRLRVELKAAAKDPITYVSNPISAFLMTYRLVKDYSDIDNLIKKDIGVQLIDNSTRLPTWDDLMGVAEGLARLQDVYLLKVEDLAKGVARGHEISRELTTSECYQIGVSMAQGKLFTRANEWFRESLRRWNADDSPGVSKMEVLDYLSYSLSEEGEFEEAMARTNDLLKLDSKHERGLQKKEIIAQWLDHIKEHGPKPKTPPPNYGNYYPLCRGEYERSASETSKLRCRYESSTTPFLKLAPLKLEEASLDPLVLVYYDVASDKEIDRILKTGRPRILRSMVGDAEKKEVSESRTSQNGWIADHEDPVATALTRRTIDMSRGLSDESFESLQVNNYGIGGHYLPHYDWTKADPPYPELKTGNRIATLMFYLSDVLEGGATVFPNIGVGMFPKKGSAIFWYNLHRNGTGDDRTLHGACPVLIGSKWVANKWIHEYHQEFKRPCGLTKEDVTIV